MKRWNKQKGEKGGDIINSEENQRSCTRMKENGCSKLFDSDATHTVRYFLLLNKHYALGTSTAFGASSGESKSEK